MVIDVNYFLFPDEDSMSEFHGGHVSNQGGEWCNLSILIWSQSPANWVWVNVNNHHSPGVGEGHRPQPRDGWVVCGPGPCHHKPHCRDYYSSDRQRSSGITPEVEGDEGILGISANYPQSAHREDHLTDIKVQLPTAEFNIETEEKTSFQDSQEFQNLISQLNKTLENLKHQDKVYKRGRIKYPDTLKLYLI